MPKVTDSHRESRREEILDAATECFARRGFHATSMNHIIQASGLSAGAIYSYFKSKQEIAMAAAQRGIGQYGHQSLRELMSQPGPAPGPVEAIRVLFSELETRGIPTTLILQLWGESLNDQGVREIILGSLQGLYDDLTQLLMRWGLETDRVAEDDAETWAKSVLPAVFAMFQGYVVQNSLLPWFDPDAYLNSVNLATQGRISLDT